MISHSNLNTKCLYFHLKDEIALLDSDNNELYMV